MDSIIGSVFIMPLNLDYTWCESTTEVTVEVQAPSRTSANKAEVYVAENFLKVSAPESASQWRMLALDLHGEVSTKNTDISIDDSKIVIKLVKDTPSLWGRLAVDPAKVSRASLRERRQAAIAKRDREINAEKEEQEDQKMALVKAAEHEQWRLDRENREAIEKRKEIEKKEAETETYTALRELDTSATGIRDNYISEVSGISNKMGMTELSIAKKQSHEGKGVGALSNDAPVRGGGGDVALSFTSRGTGAMSRLPARDRPDRQPLMPKQPEQEKSGAIRGVWAESRVPDEENPVWLKEKADEFLTKGDYRSAYRAYTAAMKLASNARCFANRGLCSLMTGRISACLDDCLAAISILDIRVRAPPGGCPPPEPAPEMRLRAALQARMALCNAWLGNLVKAQSHLTTAAEVAHNCSAMRCGLMAEWEVKKLEEDVLKAKLLIDVFEEKSEVDKKFREGDIAGALEGYQNLLKRFESVETSQKMPGRSIIASNIATCLLKLEKSGGIPEDRVCTEDSIRTSKQAADLAREYLSDWILPMKPVPRKDFLTLEPPLLHDKSMDVPTPGSDWLMKHNAGPSATVNDMPPIPAGWEWQRDPKEKDGWIAVKSKPDETVIAATQAAWKELQDAVFTKEAQAISKAVEIAKTLDVKIRPTDKALHEAETYMQSLRDYEQQVDTDYKQWLAERYRTSEQVLLAVRTTSSLKAHAVGKAFTAMEVKTREISTQ